MRLRLIAILFCVLSLLASCSFSVAQSPQPNQNSAVLYLTGHFNQTVGLIYESEDTGTQVINGTIYSHDQIYYIYSDNLLAEWALKPYEPQISNKINQTILSYNLPNSNFFEVLFGKRIPQNLKIGTQLIIGQYSDHVIMAEFHNSSTLLDQDQYGDTLIYQSLNCYLSGNNTGAEYYFYKAYDMWDGKGINDAATQTDHVYANYKLALILYASEVLNLSIGNYSQIEAKLWSMQQANGGITSLADQNGNPIGSANTETTSMALLPYNAELIQTIQSSTPKPSPSPSPTPSPQIALLPEAAYAIAAVVIIVIVATIAFFLRKQAK